MELQEINRSENDKDSYFIKDESVMTSAVDVLTEISSNKRIFLDQIVLQYLHGLGFDLFCRLP